jgi:hypothetical protein
MEPWTSTGASYEVWARASATSEEWTCSDIPPDPAKERGSIGFVCEKTHPPVHVMQVEKKRG